jgi:hypothetical protein
MILIVAHYGTSKQHVAHLERCEGCGQLGPCCQFEQLPMIGTDWMLTFCTDKVACGLRIHIMVHEPGRPYRDCTYCVSGTDTVPPAPDIPDTVEEILKLIDGDPWRLGS